MKFDFAKDRRSKRAIADLIITSSMDVIEKVIFAKKEDGIYDLVLTINGVETDVENYFNRWQEQVEEMITEKAKELVKDKFYSVVGQLEDVAEVIRNLKSNLDTVLTEKLKDWNIEDWQSERV